MTARTRQRDPAALKTTRLRLAPQLTREEARELEERAREELRSLSGDVARLFVEKLGSV